MEKKAKILLLATGGTIASVELENGLTPQMKAEQLLAYIPEAQEKYDITAVQLFNIDSTNMKPSHWQEIVSVIEENYDAFDGFVICHGTDTMAYTSAALSYMIQDADKAIVITGSQKPIIEDSTDARVNLLDAILYAADPLSKGVSIVFNGNVIAGTRAKKTYAYSYNAFSSVNFPFLAIIQNGRIIRFIEAKENNKPVSFHRQLHESVVILKLIPGTREDILEFLFRNYDCIVIESFGVGGIPDSLLDALYRQLEIWTAKGKIVVFATQVVNEGSNMEIYEVGRKVKKDFNLMEAYDMTLEAVVSKLMVLMAEYPNDYQTVYEKFYETVNYDQLLK